MRCGAQPFSGLQPAIHLLRTGARHGGAGPPRPHTDRSAAPRRRRCRVWCGRRAVRTPCNRLGTAERGRWRRGRRGTRKAPVFRQRLGPCRARLAETSRAARGTRQSSSSPLRRGRRVRLSAMRAWRPAADSIMTSLQSRLLTAWNLDGASRARARSPNLSRSQRLLEPLSGYLTPSLSGRGSRWRAALQTGALQGPGRASPGRSPGRPRDVVAAQALTQTWHVKVK